MKVKVKYYGVMREFGTEECYDMPLNPETCRLSDVFTEIIKSKGRRFAEIIYDPDGQFSHHLSIILNNRPVTFDQESVDENSVIKIIPYIAGG